jgi:hypothetical protein
VIVLRRAGRRRVGRWLAGVAFALTAAWFAPARADVEPGPPAGDPWELKAAPDAHVIVDDYLRGATPEEAAEGLRFCEAVPGCRALWQQDVGTVLILRPVPVDTGDVGAPELPPIGN